MASQGSKAYAVEYNNLYNAVNYVLGPSSGQYGYGQSLTAITTSVAAGERITRAHWANLRVDLLRIATHQGLSENGSWASGNTTSIPALPTVTSTTKISANLINSYVNAINVMTLSSNVYKLAVGQYSDEALTSSTRTADWNGTIRHYFYVNFGSAENARYFFNSGGTIRITPTFSRSTNTSINYDWETLINGVGTISFGYTNTTVSGTEVSSLGFYDLNNSVAQQIYTRSGGSQNAFYQVNDYTVRAYCNAANNSSGGATIVYFECEFKDDKGYRDPLWPQGDEPATGTVVNTIRMFRPSGTNVAVSAPGATNTTTL